MERKKSINPITLFYVLVGYVVLQFSWWLYLIFSLYKQTYSLEQLEHKTWMLIGEGSVFLLILLSGFYIIRKAFKREKELNKLQENFLQSVSHELKTPISSVGLYLQTLQKRELDEAKRQDIYGRSLAEIERLNMLVSDILTARNIESQNYFFAKEKFNLNEYLLKTIERLQDSVLKNHSVEHNLEEVLGELDKNAMDSIVYNLIENAVKYSDEGSLISFSLKKASSKIIFEIQDKGVGISDDLKEKVFDKFFRIENETTRKSKGTGLGLHITKFLVTGQGGSIKLKDNTPSGLIVQIEFDEQK
ncbi:MAG: two-component system phosphate regulon sensor histidine kinase PhoR [Arenicella sp.]|jgi:two-component system phosphate regulon sensor histidine kinase PhoR